MLGITVATLCCILLCCCPCNSQHLCDIDRWMADNDMPINKLDVSANSKAKLAQSVRSPDKLIKCSELRLIHKEAELDRPFKQNRYKVGHRQALERAKSDEDARGVESDSRHSDDTLQQRRRDDRGEAEAHDDADDRSSRGSRAEDEDGRSRRSDDTGEAASTSYGSSSWNEELASNTVAEGEKQPPEQPIVLKQQKQPQDSQNDQLHAQNEEKQLQESKQHQQEHQEATATNSRETELETTVAKLQKTLNESSNGTSEGAAFKFGNRTDEAGKDPVWQNRSATDAAANDKFSWLQHCLTCPLQSDKNATHRSWRICGLFRAKEEVVRQTPGKRDRLGVPLSALCQLCRLECTNRSVHLCEIFFPNASWKVSLPAELAINSSADQLAMESQPPAAGTNYFVLSCLQCVASDRSALWRNRTQSICVFVATYQPSRMSKRQLLADSLKFIDTEAAVDQSAKADARGPQRDDLGEPELSTRVRREARDHETANEADSTTQRNRSLSDSSTKPANSNDAATVDQQLDTLSNSAFMERLFDALLSKRKEAAAGGAQRNVTAQLDNLSSKLDQQVNLTSQKSNRSELNELETRVQSLEARLTKALAQMEERNRRLAYQVRRLEATSSVQIAACQERLGWVNSTLASITKRHDSQVSILNRRMLQMSRRIRQTECRYNRSVLHPSVPQMFQQKPEHQHEQYHHGEVPIASAALPGVSGKSAIDDCSEMYARNKKSGQEIGDGIFVANLGLSAPVHVRCDMKNDGWTYILSRDGGRTDFFRNWTSYRTGFGDPSGEHFLGLDALAEMTARRRYKLWVILEDWEGSIKSVNYGHFQVLGERYNFQLHVSHFNGESAVGDSLSSHSNASFSTFDSDNDFVDKKFGGNCAKRFRGGFWYFSCYRANPTGQYYTGGRIPDKRCDGIVWKTWKGPHYSLKAIHMKIRPLCS